MDRRSFVSISGAGVASSLTETVVAEHVSAQPAAAQTLTAPTTTAPREMPKVVAEGSDKPADAAQ